MAGGQAEPPMTVRFKEEKFKPFGFMWLNSICQTVGTPAAKVTFSASINS